MAKGKSPAVFRDIHTLFHVGTSTGLTDAQLLDRFRDRSDRNSSEAAFAGLMARHGPMVMGVCRRALRNTDDVADAFQATFLILVRKADAVRVEDSLGRWLYGVSRRVSVRARLAAARRSAREGPGIELAAAPDGGDGPDELREVLDEEIGRLPERFRSAIVLCELEGFGHDEAARQLGCAVGTVKSRLSRAREKLRARLIRRGVAPAAWAICVESTSAALPAKLLEMTVRAAVGSANGVVSPAVTLLIQGVLRAMLVKKLSMIAITVVASLGLATGVGVMARQAATRPRGDQSGGLRAQKKVGFDDLSNNSVRSTAIDLGESTKPDDELFDRIELLRLDVQLLLAEVQARQQGMEYINGNLVQIQVNDADPATGNALIGDAKQSQVESLKKKLQGSRKEYLAKKNELRKKQRELEALEAELSPKEPLEALEAELLPKQPVEDAPQAKGSELANSTAVAKRRAERRKPIPVSAASDAPGTSSKLEQRLSAIEGKLDSVLKALEDLKRETR